MNRALLVWVAALALLAPVPTASSATFRSVVDNFSSYNGSAFTTISSPGINNNDQLVFEGRTANGFQAIFLADLSIPAAPLTPLIDTAGPYADFTPLFHPITDNGVVALHARRDNNVTEILTVNTSGVVTPLVDSSGTFSSFSSLDINEAGQVAFFGTSDSGLRGVYTVQKTGPTPVITTIADATGVFERFQLPYINESGDVLYWGSDSDTETFKLLVDHAAGGETTVVHAPFGTAVIPYHLNDAGDVTYHRSIPTPIELRLFDASDGSTQAIFDADDGVTFNSSPEMAINNRGQVAFATSNHLVLADRNGFDIVLKPGDPLLGSTLSNLFHLKSLNDKGDIGFQYILANGRIGIAVASTLGADFDEDGDVDDADLGIWNTAYGTTAGGDADHDGDSDGADFLAWQDQFTGELNSPLAVSQTVPEPAETLLLMSGLAIGWRRLLSPRREAAKS